MILPDMFVTRLVCPRVGRSSRDFKLFLFCGGCQNGGWG